MDMRLFIAINFNEDTRARLVALRDELRFRSECGNFSLPENLHLTLAFLGECSARQMAGAKDSLDFLQFAPLSIMIERIGNFQGGLWWAGVKLTTQLLGLQRELSDALKKRGFALENRKFSPHITIGRNIITDVMPWSIEPFGETIGAISLMKSERVNGKLNYTKIHSKPADD